MLVIMRYLYRVPILPLFCYLIETITKCLLWSLGLFVFFNVDEMIENTLMMFAHATFNYFAFVFFKNTSYILLSYKNDKNHVEIDIK